MAEVAFLFSFLFFFFIFPSSGGIIFYLDFEFFAFKWSNETFKCFLLHPCSSCAAALSDGAKPKPHTLNNALIPLQDVEGWRLVFVRIVLLGTLNRNFLFQLNVRRGVLDVPVQCTIYPAGRECHFPPGIYLLWAHYCWDFSLFWSYCPSFRVAKCSVSSENGGKR